MLILSWNVDGYDDNIHNTLSGVIKTNQPDIIFLSETKRKREVLENQFQQFPDYSFIINAHCPANMHGVAMLIRKYLQFKEIPIIMNIPVRKDTKSDEASTGRIIVVHINGISIVGSYTPNSGQSDQVKLNYRVNVWDVAFIKLLETLRSYGSVIWLGDINVAPNDIDVSHPEKMKHFAGYTIEERNNFQSLITTGKWIDVWRHQNSDVRGYTWVGYNYNDDYGMRLDNIVITDDLLPLCGQSFITKVTGRISDHNLIGLILNPI
jgi:exodeoxyribonuclease-3